MAEIRGSGTWGSALTADEFTAIKSTGFEPVGQVLGAAVYNIGYTGGYAARRTVAATAWAGLGGGYAVAIPYNSVTATSGSGSLGLVRPAGAHHVRGPAPGYRPDDGRMPGAGRSRRGRRPAHDRRFPAGGLEFKAIGTAVRAPGAVTLREPFTSDLSGQDFAKLVMAGWVPAGLVLGIAIGARHDDWVTVTQTRWGSGNTEVQGYTDLVNATRHDARTSWGWMSPGTAPTASCCRRWKSGSASTSARSRKAAATTCWRRRSSAPRSPASGSPRHGAATAGDHVAGPAAAAGRAGPARPVTIRGNTAQYRQ